MPSITYTKSTKFPDELDFAYKLALSAKQLTLDNFGLHTKVSRKADGSPVTSSDLDINKMVINEVKSSFPNDGVIGEEYSYMPERSRVWFVDPIDGTHPYSLGIPISTFCLSLAINNSPVMCVVFDPFMDRFYQAIKGEGAYLNAENISVSKADKLENNYCVLSARMGGKFPSTGDIYNKVDAKKGKSFAFSSSAYGCMLVASGKAVAYIGGHVKPWDAAASKLIIDEAGGKVTDLNGSEFYINHLDNGILATNSAIHDEIISLINN